MKPYNELTRQGQLRRLRQLTLEALKAYDIQVKRVNFFTRETNTMFKVRSDAGERFMFRIYSDEETTLKENQAEIYWLQAIKRDTNIKITEPVARRDGRYITIASLPGVPGKKRCILFKWVPGRQLEKALNPKNYAKLGEAMARLHNHAGPLGPIPLEIQPKKWDKVFYYPGESAIYHTAAYQHLFSREVITVLEAVIEKANKVFDDLFSNPDALILIHGDLHYWNVHVHRGELYLLDFEDIMLGYPLQDIAITLYYGQDRDGYPQLRSAFQRGYTRLRP
ncbi:MAG: phosphotransferase, partial [Anaerolineales bacterium]|nr:phosphotransferase [Anaerolineales bacterium]